MPKMGFMRTDLLEIPATVTERGQTTVPAAIRRALSLGKRDRIVWRALADGTVTIEKQVLPENEADPVLSAFLMFLERDMERNPDRLCPVPLSLIEEARALIHGVEVDLNERLPDDLE